MTTWRIARAAVAKKWVRFSNAPPLPSNSLR
jgi:hypothetical protein